MKKTVHIFSFLFFIALLFVLVSMTSCHPDGDSSGDKNKAGKAVSITLRQPSKKNENENKDNNDVKSKGKTVIVDPGHGFRDPGAGAENYELGKGIDESVVTLQVSLLLKQDLIDLGYNVIMSHEGEATPEIQAYLEPENWFDPEERAQYFNTLTADCLVSLHCNMFPQDNSARGTRVYVQQVWDESVYKIVPDPISLVLADKIVESYNASVTGTKDAISDMSDLAVLRGRAYPATLIEMGFVSNPDDAKMLVDPEWQAAFSKAVAEGIDQYLSENSQS